MVLIIFNSIFLLCEFWQHFSLLIAPFQLLKATNKQTKIARKPDSQTIAGH
jgi:hypothetical protein